MAAGNRDLVVIGGSAGASAPLRSILSSLPQDLPAAVLVVMHVPSTGEGVFPTLSNLPSPAALPVQNAEDGGELRTGRIYIAPPNRHLLIFDGHIKLGTGPRENLVRPAVDPLFRSAAISHGPRTIGIILSGLLNDGASGLAAIKRCGGIALVQAPSDSYARDMPVAALEATPVDLSAPRGELAEAVLRFVAEPPGPAREVPEDIRFEVEVAAGGRIDHDRLGAFAEASSITCPDCGGVLSEVHGNGPLRFRCQVGHAFTGGALVERQEGLTDEAMRVALRIIEERAALVGRMAREAGRVGRTSMAEMYDRRVEEYRASADVLRKAIGRMMNPDGQADPAESAADEDTAR
jgi:two-component system, chemotaxis family, protein-glutamate methylesterase/glutaminase